LLGSSSKNITGRRPMPRRDNNSRAKFAPTSPAPMIATLLECALSQPSVLVKRSRIIRKLNRTAVIPAVASKKSISITPRGSTLKPKGTRSGK